MKVHKKKERKEKEREEATIEIFKLTLLYTVIQL